MAESDPYSDLSDLVVSIMNLALPGNDTVDQSEAPALDPPALEPIPGILREAPSQYQPWSTGEESVAEWRHQREVRHRSFRPRPSRSQHFTGQSYFEWFPPLHSLVPMTIKVSRATQTMAIAIPRIPEESRTFPVPWARRVRTASVGTQTEDSAWMQHSPEEPTLQTPEEPEWDLLPGEVFSLDEFTPQPLDASSLSAFPSGGVQEPHRSSSLLTNPFHDPSLFSSSFLQTIYSGSPQAASLAGLPFHALPATGWPTTLPERDGDEVIIHSTLGWRRTVATNTSHVGWRRTPRRPVDRVRWSIRARNHACGITADANTQTEF